VKARRPEAFPLLVFWFFSHLVLAFFLHSHPHRLLRLRAGVIEPQIHEFQLLQWDAAHERSGAGYRDEGHRRRSEEFLKTLPKCKVVSKTRSALFVIRPIILHCFHGVKTNDFANDPTCY
jgi:hypothetical protein